MKEIIQLDELRAWLERLPAECYAGRTQDSERCLIAVYLLTLPGIEKVCVLPDEPHHDNDFRPTGFVYLNDEFPYEMPNWANHLALAIDDWFWEDTGPRELTAALAREILDDLYPAPAPGQLELFALAT